MIASINPATGETLRTFEPVDESQVDQAIARAAAAFETYRHTSFSDRARWLNAAAAILESEKDAFARIMTLEMGKPIGAARAEAAKCALACRYYAEHGERLLADEPVEAGAGRSFIRYQPIGPVLAVMPWNFPFWQVFRFAAPGPDGGQCGSAQARLQRARSAPWPSKTSSAAPAFPRTSFQTLLIGAWAVARLLDDPRVKAVSLTGSEPAGAAGGQPRRPANQEDRARAGRQRSLHRHAPRRSRPRRRAPPSKPACINNGQSCIAAKRFIVDHRVAPEFERRFVEAMDALRVGDPMDESTQVGPLATPAILDGLDQQVRRSVEMGARLLTGGQRLERPGHFYAPTVLTDVPENSPAYREELFGPVAVLLRSHGIDDAIRLANDTEFGLGASAWTNDPAEQRRFIDEIEAGMVFLNGMVASDPRLPFGGVKRSGYGRELSAYGIREFVNVKTVRIA